MESKRTILNGLVSFRAALMVLLALVVSFQGRAYADVVVSSDTELNDALKTEQSETISLGTDISSTTLGVGGTNSLDLAGFALEGENVTFDAEGLSLSITNSDATTGGLSFERIATAAGSNAGTLIFDGLTNSFDSGLALDGTQAKLSLTTQNSGSIVVGATSGGLNLTNTNFSLDGSTWVVGQFADEENGLSEVVANVTMDADSTFALKNSAQFHATGDFSTATPLSLDASGLYVGTLTKLSTDALNISLANGAELVVGGDLSTEDFSFSVADESTSGVRIEVGGTLNLAESFNVSGSATGVNTLVAGALTLADDTTLTISELGVVSVEGALSAANGANLVLDGSSDSAVSALVVGTLGTNIATTIQNGAELQIGGNLDLNNSQFSKDADATSGGKLYVLGTTTLSNDLALDGTNSAFEFVSTKVLDLAGDREITIDGGRSMQIGSLDSGSNSVKIALDGASSLAVVTSEEDDTWTGNLTLGAENNGGAVQVDILGGSTLSVANNLNAWLQDGDAINIVGTQATDDATAKTAYLTVLGASKIVAADGTSSISVGQNAQLGVAGNGSFAPAAGAALDISLQGQTSSVAEGETAQTATILSDADLVFGGEGRLDVNVGTNAYISAKNLSLTSSGAGSGDGSDSGTHVVVDGSTAQLYGTESLTIGDNAGGDSTGANVSVELKNNGVMNTGGALVVGKAGEATISGVGTVASAGAMIIGESGSADVSLEDGSIVEAAGLVIGQNDGSDASLSISGSSSVLNILAQTTDDTLSAAGSGSLNVSGLYDSAKPGESGVFVAAGGGIYLNGDATFDSSYLYFGTDADDATKLAVLSTGEGSVQIKNGSIVAGSAIIHGDTTVSGNSILAGTPTIYGDLSVQSSTYEVALGLDGTSEKITVHEGDVTLSNAKMTAYFTQSGTFSETEWTILSVDDGYSITGTWDISSDLKFYDFTSRVEGNDMIISTELDREYFEKILEGENANRNEMEVGRFLDTYHDSWYNTLLGLADLTNEEIHKAAAQLQGSARANSMSLARQSLWAPVLDRLSWDENCRGYTGIQAPYATNGFRSAMWFQSGYRGLSVDGSNGTGYDTDAFNLLVGMDTVWETYFSGGVFLGYSNPTLEQDYATAEAQNYSVGFYLGYKMFGGFELKGMMAYTYSDYDLRRDLSMFGYTALADFNGSALTASIELARPFYLGTATLRPLIAIDSECVWQNGVAETGAGLYGLYYEDSDDTWTYARLGATLDLAPNDRLTFRGKAFYSFQLDGDSAPTANAKFANTNEMLYFVGEDLGDGYISAGATLSYAFGMKKRFLANVSYDGLFNDEMSAHAVGGGFQWSF
ncbi:MAG: autotransporter domain-containing protein [Planctomycetia bacterium]|nr:autotransporter domain-containing protein [Planctomycetia bacterium]